MGLSGLRVAEMCSLRVESLTHDDGYDSLKFIGKGGKPADILLPVPVMRADRLGAPPGGCGHRVGLIARITLRPARCTRRGLRRSTKAGSGSVRVVR